MAIKNYLLIAMTALAVAACSKQDDGGPGPGEPQGKPTTVKLAIKFPKAVRTYASGGDDNATEAETKINTVDVFIYDDGGSYGLTYEHFDDDFNEGEEGDPTTTTPEIKTRTGSKQIYVGVNLPSSIVNILKVGYHVNDAFTARMNELVNEDGNIAFFNSEANVEVIDESTTTLSVDVSRLVAKVHVNIEPLVGGPLHDNTGGKYSIDGLDGTFSDFSIAAGQMNTKLFVRPLVNFEDPNYETTPPGDLSRISHDPNVYVSLNGEDSKIYLPENTTADFKHNQVSYVSIRAKFTPNPTAIENNEALNADGDFWAVFTEGNADGKGVLFFANETDATTYISSSGHPSGVKVAPIPLKYTGGYCYYRLYLNQSGDLGGRYDILRNTFYTATITSINTIGTNRRNVVPGDYLTPTNPNIDELGTFPTDGGRVDPDSPIELINRSDITSTLTMKAWAPQTGDYEAY